LAYSTLFGNILKTRLFGKGFDHMFVYTVKASSIKFFCAILFSAAVLVGIVAVVPVIDSAGEVAVAALDYKGIATVEEQLSFLKELGYQVSPMPVYSDEVVIPEVFDGVYEKYNELQKSQGLNLEKYRGKTVMRYTYTENEGSDTRYVTLLIYKNRIIGCDVTTLGENGCVVGLQKTNKPQNEDSSSYEEDFSANQSSESGSDKPLA